MSDDDHHVEPQRGGARNSPKIEQDASKGAYSAPPNRGEVCYWNDKKYSDGATVCDNHQRYKCWSGKWVDIGNC